MTHLTPPKPQEPSVEEMMYSMHTIDRPMAWYHADSEENQWPCIICGVKEEVMVMVSPQQAACETCFEGFNTVNTKT